MSMMKPMLSNLELIEHMKGKGILFDIAGEEEALEFLNNHNYYYKLSSYRKNYCKYTCGPNEGKYLRLDFAYLREISTIDCNIRYIILKLCLDIEHSLKLILVNDIADNLDEDGYNIVEQWDKSYYNRSKLYKQQINSYNGSLISKYHPVYPIWTLLEIISFGDLCSIIECYDKLYPGRFSFDISLLKAVRSLRNACAHNNCLINNLRQKEIKNPNTTMRKELRLFGVIGSHFKSTAILNRPIHDFICLIILYPKIIRSKRQKLNAKKLLKSLFYKKMLRHKEYFLDNDVIVSRYRFIHKVYQKIINNY